MAEREPWQCPACRGWVRPDVEVHWCDGPDGGVTEGRPAAPKSPFTGESVTWTFPPGTVATGGTGMTIVKDPGPIEVVPLRPKGGGGLAA